MGMDAAITAFSQGFALGLSLLLAWAIDAAFGEPRNALHPVAWLGRVLAPLGRGLRAQTPAWAFAGGALAWVVVVVLLALAAWAIEQALLHTHGGWAVPLLALLLKPAFAWRMLREEVSAVEAALVRKGEAAARERLSRLVSRDVSAFDAGAIRETAVSTLAENLNDSVVAPLFWFAVAGLPGALVYRAANTMDAMWGYRGVWEWAGKWAARADDLLSWIPARITALLLYPALRPLAWRRLARVAGQTPSPNGGWPMGAMALRLGVRLTKPGVYALNGLAPEPRAPQMVRALRVSATAAWGALGLAVLACWARGAA